MESTTFPIHSLALSTPDDEEVLSGEVPALGDLIFAWGMRDIELRLIAPLHQYTAQGMDPDSMIALGHELVAEGERLKKLSSRPAEPGAGADPDEPLPSGTPGPGGNPGVPQSAILVPELETVRLIADSTARAS